MISVYFSFRNEKAFENKLLKRSLGTDLDEEQKSCVIKTLSNIVINNPKPCVAKRNSEVKYVEASLATLTEDNLYKHNAALGTDNNDTAYNNRITTFLSTLKEKTECDNDIENDTIISANDNEITRKNIESAATIIANLKCRDPEVNSVSDDTNIKNTETNVNIKGK